VTNNLRQTDEVIIITSLGPWDAVFPIHLLYVSPIN